MLGKTTPEQEANASRVGVGVLRNKPALRQPSPVASACEYDRSDFGIASLFDCVMPSVNGCDLNEPKVDSVILQNSTVSINAEVPVSFITAELSSLKYVDICLVTIHLMLHVYRLCVTVGLRFAWPILLLWRD